jgi:predicted O-methyltransferase YrrM
MLPITGGLSPASVDSLLKNQHRLDLHLADWSKDLGAGSMWDLLAACLIARHASPKTCFEIGTGFGRTTHHLALNTDTDTRIFSLDISDDAVVGRIFANQPTADRITKLTGDSKTFAFDQWLGKIDLVFVDGDHSFDGVCSDTDLAFKLVAPGGCILWDDFDPGWPGVIKALKQHSRANSMRHIVGTKLVYSPA